MYKRMGALVLVVLASLFGANRAADASGCGAGGYGCCPQPTCDAQSCFPAVQKQCRVSYQLVYDTVHEKRWHTCYQTVQETVMRNVTKTCYREEQRTCYRTVHETCYKTIQE